MSAVPSVNSGVADLTQWLSSTGTTSASSALSSKAVQSALQSASSADLVQLSQQALDLQEASGLFGNAGSSSTAANPETLLLQALNSAITGSTTSGSPAQASAAAATATDTSALQQVSELLGSNSSSVNLLG
jgi:hypothetical protein